MDSSSVSNKNKDDGKSFWDTIKQYLAVFIVIIVVILSALITLTVFGAKGSRKCFKNKKTSLGVSLVVLMVLMWTGGIIPGVGLIIAPVAFVSVIILTILSNRLC